MIWVFDKETLNVRSQIPLNTAVMTNLYTVEFEEGVKSDKLETEVFSPLDGEIISFLDRWTQPRYRITKDEIPTMAYYLAFQHARVPRALNMSKEMSEALMVKTLKDYAADKSQMDKDYEDFASKLSESNVVMSREQFQDTFENLEKHYRIDIKDEFALAMCIKGTSLYFEAFLRMDWSIVDAPRDKYFITCDAPVVSVAMVGSVNFNTA